MLATRVIAPLLPKFRRLYPRLRLDVISTPVVLDLLRGEADLALRATRPVEGSLVARTADVNSPIELQRIASYARRAQRVDWLS